MWRAAIAAGFLAAGTAAAQSQYRDNIERGRTYLYKALEKEVPSGEGYASILSFGTLALLKTAPENARHETLVDAPLRALIDRVRKEAETIDRAQWVNGHWGNYGMSAMVMCLCADDPDAHQSVLKKLVARLLKNQMDEGSWCYPPGHGKADTSQTQIVVLALWDAALAGIDVPLEFWDKMLYFHLITQSGGGPGAGGFAYNPGMPTGDKPQPQPSTASMGVAGMSSLLIGREQMPSLRKKKTKQFSIGELVRPVSDDEAKKIYVPKCTKERVDASVAGAEAFVGRVNGIKGPFAESTADRSIYYCYGLERVAALKGGNFGTAILAQHGPYVAGRQQPDGHWEGPDGPICDTCMAVMFLGRATAKKLTKLDITQLGRSQAIGGTGIPTSQGGSELARQAERYKTTAVSNISDMVKIFENPDGLIAEETAAQIETMTPKQMAELVKSLGGDTRKLRSHAYALAPAARKAALTALSRTRDFRAAPMLLDALTAKEDDVYAAARDGLRYMSRDPFVFDLPVPEERGEGKAAAAIARVKSWIDGLKLELPAFQVYTPTDEKQ